MKGIEDFVSKYVPRVFLLPVVLVGAICAVVLVPLAWLLLPTDTWDKYFE